MNQKKIIANTKCYFNCISRGPFRFKRLNILNVLTEMDNTARHLKGYVIGTNIRIEGGPIYTTFVLASNNGMRL